MNVAGKTPQTLDQQRANHAWNAKEALRKDFSPKGQTDYAGEAKKLPVRIMASGLGQSLAFILAKAKKQKEKPSSLERLHEDLTNWVIGVRLPHATRPDSMLHSIIEGDTEFLRWATDETLAYMLWLNRFLDASSETGV